MSRRSLLVSHLGSSFRSDPEDDRGSVSSCSRAITDLLTLLPPNDRSFDNLSDVSGDLSIVSHPFSEESPRCTDLGPAAGQFSSAHQEAMRDLRAQTRADSPCSTCSSCDTCSTDTWEALGIDEAKIQRVTPRPLPATLEKHIQERLNEASVERPRRPRVRSPGEESCRTPGRQSRTRGEQDDMSGLWNMLATYDEFVVTPPGFNVFQQDKPHWLDQEPIPWEQREKARRKCVKWLNNYHI